MYFIKAQTTKNHMRFFYDARYSKSAVANSTNHHKPTFQEHCTWCRKQNLNDMFLIWDKKYVGYVRIDNKHFVSIAIIEEEHRKGYGTFALENIVNRYTILHATIHKSNFASKKLFSKFPNIQIKIIDDHT